MKLRWLQRARGRNEMTNAEWKAWCEYHRDPDPGPKLETVLQVREGDQWMDVPTTGNFLHPDYS